MQLKNLSNEAALVLPDDLLWSDEHSWSPTVATSAYLITGALLIQSATRLAGRPITWVGAPDMAWVTRATVEQLRLWTAEAPSEATGRFLLVDCHSIPSSAVSEIQADNGRRIDVVLGERYAASCYPLFAATAWDCVRKARLDVVANP